MSCSGCAKCLLVFINAIFLLIGLGMFALGLVLHFSADFSKTAFSALVDQLEKSANDAGKNVDTSGFSIADIVYSATIVLIVLGLFIAILALLGIIGASCTVKVVLIVYLVITLVIFLAQLVMLLIFIIDRSVYDDAIKPALKDGIEEEYAGFEGTDATSLIWNAVMIELKCCGVDSYLDFKQAGQWPDRAPQGNGYQTPLACCKAVSNDDTCAKVPTDTNNNWKTGCYEELFDYVVSDYTVIGAAAGVLALQLLILILTVIIIKSMASVDTMV